MNELNKDNCTLARAWLTQSLRSRAYQFDEWSEKRADFFSFFSNLMFAFRVSYLCFKFFEQIENNF